MIYAERLAEIARRKEHLVARAAVQRERIAEDLLAWQRPLMVVERGIAATQYMKAHPAVVAAAVVGLMILGRRPLVRWIGRALVVWRGWRALQGWMGLLSAR